MLMIRKVGRMTWLWAFAFLVLATVWLAKSHKKADEERQRKAAESHVANIDAVAKAAVQQHMNVLRSKWKQLTYLDDYGNFVDDDWRREARYFAETVIAPKLVFDPLTFESDVEQAAYTVGYEVLEHESALGGLTTDPTAEYDPFMPGIEFEQLVERLLSSAGATVRRTPVTGDQGVDLLADYAGVTVAIQCKRSGSSIGNKAVQEVNAGRGFYSASSAWVVSDAPFTKGARQLASSLDVELVQYLTIHDHLKRLATSV
jgi:hypothetical protein